MIEVENGWQKPVAAESPAFVRSSVARACVRNEATINSQSEATQSARPQDQHRCGESIDIPPRTLSWGSRDRGDANTRTVQGDLEAWFVSSFKLSTLIVMGRANSTHRCASAPGGRHLFCQCMRLCDQHAQSCDALLDLSPHLGPFISHDGGGRATGAPHQRCAALHRVARIGPRHVNWFRGIIRARRKIDPLHALACGRRRRDVASQRVGRRVSAVGLALGRTRSRGCEHSLMSYCCGSSSFSSLPGVFQLIRRDRIAGLKSANWSQGC